MRNPYVNALLAAAYIGVVVLVVSSTAHFQLKDNIFMPMAVLSLFVVSAAVMGFLFVFRPAELYLEGKKQEGLLFFGKTVVTFAICGLVYAATILFVGEPADPQGQELVRAYQPETNSL